MSGRVVSRRSALVGLTAGAAAVAGGVAGLELAGASGPQRAAAAADEQERRYEFNQGWLFGGRYVRGAELPGYDDSGYARVTLPHTVTDLSWFGWDYRTWEQIWIYRKHIHGAAVAGGRVLVTFDGVMTDATLTLNGRPVSAHAGGYLPWTAELTGHLRPGDNVLAVIVDGRWLLGVPPDALPGGPPTMDYLQPAGIYRDARLEVVPWIYLQDVFARPEQVLAASRVVRVMATVQAGVVPRDGAATLTAALLDGDRVLATARSTVRIGATGARTVTLVIGGIGPVTYWSPEQPKLYTVRTTLSYAGAAGTPGGTHTVSTRIGFREAVFRLDGFYLNGSRQAIFGLNRHQLYPYLGMAAPARLQRRDAEILKNELNVNMVRCSHYPQSPHFLDACDELGIMVWEEPPGWVHMGGAAFRREVLGCVTDMVIRDRNRPSVVAWATRLDETGSYPALYARARQIAYAYDGSRQTTGAMTTQSEQGWAEDVFAYDDYNYSGGMPRLAPPLRGVPYLVSESVGAFRPSFLWFDPPAALAAQAYAHALAHDQAHADPRYAGLLAWCGFDYYSGPPPANDAPARLRNWHAMKTPGVADVFRALKPAAAVYQSQADPATRPVIRPAFFWDNRTPPGAAAMFATNCDRLEISLGGRHHATVTPDAATFGRLPHPPAFADLTAAGTPLPDLRADGYAGDSTRPAATLLMTADTSRDRLLLTADDAAVVADGSDATRITFRATDAYGNHRPGVTGDVTLSVAGPAVLIGSNPFPFGMSGGVGGAFLRSVPGETGTVTVTARHATLGEAAVTVRVGPVRSGSFL
jgi:beta-galactosidase